MTTAPRTLFEEFSTRFRSGVVPPPQPVSNHAPRRQPRWHRAAAFVLGSFLSLSTVSARAQDAQPAATLRTVLANGDEHELPIIDEQVEVVVDRGHADVTFSRTFQNETREELEGVFVTRLGEVATATGFSYWNGGQRVVGEMFEREAAREIYESISGTGRDPGLLERTGEGEFSFRVAPIHAGEKKRVQLGVSRFLTRVGSGYELRLPATSVNSRFHLIVKKSEPLSRLVSTSHEVDVVERDDAFEITSKKALSKRPDFILHHDIPDADFRLQAALHRDAGHPAYVIVRLPAPASVEPVVGPRDITLVLDRSGSMSGAPIEAARRAALGVIARLPENDRVNVIAFDDGVESLFDSPRRVGDVRQRARAFVEAIRDGGGTDIARALEEALRTQKTDERPDVLLFLTDGQSDTRAALNAAQKAGDSVRLYSVGIGTGVDRPLLSRLAREHRGRFTFIADEAQLEREVARLYDSISAPVLTDLQLKVDGARLSGVYPTTLPDLFRGDEIRFAARLEPEPGKTGGRIIVTARQGKETRRLEAELSWSQPRSPWIGRSWAEQRVDALLEHVALEGETDELKNEVVELALAYDLVTPYTSFLAVPESEITDATRGTIEAERERRRRILAKHDDAAALSRSVMPPGDPLLTVKAPRSAQSVTARFPFGLALDLHFDDVSERWETRFLVPFDVADGDYRVEIEIVERDGTITMTYVPYTIDSGAPALDVDVTSAAGSLFVRVRADSALREVRLQLTSDDEIASICPLGGCLLTSDGSGVWIYEGTLPPGHFIARVVASDLARNESVEEVPFVVIDPKGCAP